MNRIYKRCEGLDISSKVRGAEAMRDLFSTAIVRLTAVFVTVLAIVCVLFSGLIYTLASNEIDRTSRRQVVGFRNLLGRFIVDEQESERLRTTEADDARARLRAQLFLGNLAVIGTGTVLSYFFAKKTLRPLEESVKAQERFTSDASHELRTPLASMRTEIEVALRDKKLKLSDAKELLSSNLEEVVSMNSLTENLLALARNQTVESVAKVDSKKLLGSIAKKQLKLLAKHKVTLSTEIAQVTLHINKDSLAQLVTILLDNAIKYSGSGSKVHLKTSLDGEQYTIKVSDNGQGIPKDKLAHIFDRFSRADASRTAQVVEGHGLGLSIAKMLVESMNGRINVKSVPGKETSFYVYLPSGVESKHEHA